MSVHTDNQRPSFLAAILKTVGDLAKNGPAEAIGVEVLHPVMPNKQTLMTSLNSILVKNGTDHVTAEYACMQANQLYDTAENAIKSPATRPQCHASRIAELIEIPRITNDRQAVSDARDLVTQAWGKACEETQKRSHAEKVLLETAAAAGRVC
ncbi:MAG: hypothetical protein K2Q12_04185 [Rickettsiales bacterium]|nr:hypothetical protein [Rickettsiales bacterium]